MPHQLRELLESSHKDKDCQNEGKKVMTGDFRGQRGPALGTLGILHPDAVRDISRALNALIADKFALYLKTKHFHWHMSGPHFRDYQRLLDDQSTEILAATDAIAERVRKLGGTTLRSVGHVARLQRILDNDADYVTPPSMLAELREDNRQLAARLREAYELCEEHRDIATASLLGTWIDEAEGRTWFLFEASHGGDFE